MPTNQKGVFTDKEIQWMLLQPRAKQNSEPRAEPRKNEPTHPELTLSERGPSPYSDKISLDRGKLSLQADGILQPDLKTPSEILVIDPSTEKVDPTNFSPVKRIGEAAIDRDGSPHGYMPNDVGSEKMANGLDRKGKPVGFLPEKKNALGGLVSTTGWQRGPSERQSSYVDARRVPYVAMPASYFKGENRGKYGDFVQLTNKTTKKKIWAVVADSRGSNNKGIEMSEAAATALGVEFNAKGTTKNYKDIALVAYKGSASGRWYE